MSKFTNRVRAGTVAAMSGAAMTGCEPPAPTAPAATRTTISSAPRPPEPINDRTLSGILSGYAGKAFHFIDQDGKEVNIAALLATLTDRQVTLTSGLKDCALLCPVINQSLRAVGEINPNVVSIIISVDPKADGKDQKSRDAFAAHLKQEGVTQRTIILFPKDLDPEIARQVQWNAGLSPKEYDSRQDESRPHSSVVQLYLNDRCIGQKSGMRAEEFEEWQPLLSYRPDERSPG